MEKDVIDTRLSLYWHCLQTFLSQHMVQSSFLEDQRFLRIQLKFLQRAFVI